MFDFFAIIGSVLSLVAWTILIVVPIRRIFGLRNVITERHLNLGGITLLVTSIIVSCGYVLELWMAWYSHSSSEWTITMRRMWDSWYGWSYCILIATNAIMPMMLWFRRVRCNDILLFFIALMIQVGIWFERIMVIRARSES